MYQDYYETDKIIDNAPEQSHSDSFLGQISWVLWALSIVGFVAVMFSVTADKILMSAFAYINCLILCYALLWFLRKRTISSLVPVLFIPLNLFGWPVPILYFAIFHPDGAYHTFSGEVSYFDAGVRVQLCILLFFTGYFAIMFLSLRKERPIEGGAIANPGRLAFVSILLGAPIVIFDAASKVASLPGILVYFAKALFDYLNGIFFIAGALIKNISKIIKWLFYAFITLTVFFYTVGNNRGMAVSCVFPIVLGMLLFSSISRKTKIIIVISIIFAFPVYITIANTTRALTGTVGFEEGFGYRLSALKEWRTATSETSTIDMTLGRLFYTGGHSIIARTPSQIPYRHFSPVRYLMEMFENLIPGRIYYNPYYRDIYLMNDYGLLVTEKTAVNFSMIGSFWLLGGYVYVFFGGIAVGLLHWFLIAFLRKSWAVSKAKAFVYFSVLAPKLLWAPRVTLFEHWHLIVYNFVLASVVYLIIKVLSADYRPVTYIEDSYSLLSQQEELQR